MLNKEDYNIRQLKAKQYVCKVVDELISTGNGKIEVRIVNKAIRQVLKTEITNTDNSSLTSAGMVQGENP
jgi:hypothetical protein